MASVVIDLLPRDAELARRAAGGDGAAFVRLYDRYSTEIFATALAATGSVEAAADATQTAFLRVLRWPPALGAPDEDVLELLFALALGGPHEDWATPPEESDHKVARLVGVGWLRSETVSKAGARFDADWSEHLWHPEPAREPETVAEPSRRRWRLRLRAPSPAAAAAVLLIFLAGLAGTLLLGGGSSHPIDAAPASATSEHQLEKRSPLTDANESKLFRNKSVQPLLAP
jgi:DNA-directed RNA polymerase specialized sigma24 family protein